MTTGWLVKVVVVLGVLALAAFEAGSPLVTRAQLDGVAHDAADEAARELARSGDPASARSAAEAVAAGKDATVTAFSTGSPGRVHVTVQRHARSLVLERWSATDDWYDVEVSATSGGTPG